MERFSYGKPNMKQLRKNYSLIDMHIHSTASDGDNSPEEIIRQAKRLGIGIAITDHNVIEGSLQACRHKDILVIPGMEFAAKKDIHTLLYFYNASDLRDFYERYAEGKAFRYSVFEISELASKYNCLFGIAHPTGYALLGFGKIRLSDKDYSGMKRPDFMEIINGHQFRHLALDSYRLASRLNTGITGGSDAHYRSDIGCVVTCSKEKTVKGFLDSIKRHETYVHGKTMKLLKRYIKSPIYFMRTFHKRF